MLLSIDFLFIIGHILVAVVWDYGPKNFLVDADGGYPEYFQYLKYILIVLLAAYLAFFKKEYGYLSWLFLFFILLIDDAFQVHERFGHALADRFALSDAYGLRAIDYGELIYAIIVGGTLFWLMVLPFYKGSKAFRKTFIDIVILFALFLFFGIGIDMLHQLLIEIHMVSAVFALIEDGGEMITLSLMVWYFYFIVVKESAQRAHLLDFFNKRRKLKRNAAD